MSQVNVRATLPPPYGGGPEVLVLVLESDQALAKVGLEAAVTGLSQDERRRWQALRQPQDRVDFLAARATAREAVGLHFSSTPYAGPIAQRCATCGGPHGKPRVPNHPRLHLSWSHARGLVAAAVASSPVGIDVEHIVAKHPPREDTSATTHRERWLAWTRMESLVKLEMGDLDAALTWDLGWPESPSGRLFIPPSTGRGNARSAVVADLHTGNPDVALSVAQLTWAGDDAVTGPRQESVRQ